MMEPTPDQSGQICPEHPFICRREPERRNALKLEHETIRDDKLMQLYFAVITPPSDLIPVHWHSHLEILYILEGTMTASVNDNLYELARGDILVINPKDIHTTYGECSYCLLQIPPFHLECIDADRQLLHFGEYLPASNSLDSVNHALFPIFQELMCINREQKPGYRLLFLSQVYQLLYVLYERDSSLISAKSKHRTERDFQRVEQTMQYVKKNYRSQFTLEDVAEELSLTPEYFCRMFKKVTGQTFFTYVNQVRLLHFYHDLLHTDESITYLLEKHGINNYKVFIREFKKAYGATPHRLRMQYRDS